MRIKMRSVSYLAVTAVLALGLMVFAEGDGGVSVGQAAPQFSLPDQDGKTVSLGDFAGKIVVLEWVNPECPFVQRHYQAKTMINLATEYAPKDVAWVAINSTHTATNATNKDWISKNQLSYPILNDAEGKVGKSYGAKNTPEMFVIGKDGTLLYMGGIDNDPDNDKGSARVNYVNQALSEILAGKSVSTPFAKPYGCSVKYAQ